MVRDGVCGGRYDGDTPGAARRERARERERKPGTSAAGGPRRRSRNGHGGRGQKRWQGKSGGRNDNNGGIDGSRVEGFGSGCPAKGENVKRAPDGGTADVRWTPPLLRCQDSSGSGEHTWVCVDIGMGRAGGGGRSVSTCPATETGTRAGLGWTSSPMCVAQRTVLYAR